MRLDDNVLKFIGLGLIERQYGLSPAAFQIFIQTRLWFYGKGKDSIVALVAEIRLEGFILEIDVVNLVDQMFLPDQSFAGGLLIRYSNTHYLGKLSNRGHVHPILTVFGILFEPYSGYVRYD